MNCHRCNAPLKPGATFCVNCGAPVAPAPVQPVQPHEPAGLVLPQTQPLQPVQPPRHTMNVYPSGAPSEPGLKGNSKVVVICGIIVALILIGAGIYWLAYSMGENDGNSGWEEEQNNEYVADEPEFRSDVTPSEGSSSPAPFDYTAMVCFHELTTADLTGCPLAELRLMRNTIYARHGYIFPDADLQEYFRQFDWYSPRNKEVPENEMSQTELRNITLIRHFEMKSSTIDCR